MVAPETLLVTSILTNFLEKATIIYLKFEFFIAEIEKLLKNEYLERDHYIDSLLACITLTLLCVTLGKKWPQ